MEQDFGELAIRKPPYFHAFFPFRPKNGSSSIVELVNDILFDTPSLVGLPQTWNGPMAQYVMEFDMMINTRFYLHDGSKFNSNREL
jgi:hypothetical protein